MLTAKQMTPIRTSAKPVSQASTAAPGRKAEDESGGRPITPDSAGR